MLSKKLTTLVVAALSGTFLTGSAIASVCGIATGSGGGSGSSNFSIDVDLAGSGGFNQGSASYQLSGSAGQPTQNLDGTSPGYGGATGFWNALVTYGEPVFDNAECQGVVTIHSIADFDAYVSADFGRNGGTTYKHLRVASSINEPEIGLLSPCRVKIKSGLTLTANNLSIEGRKGVVVEDYTNLDGDAICIGSEQRFLRLGDGISVIADKLTLQARKLIDLGRNFNAQIVDDLTVASSHGGFKLNQDSVINLTNMDVSANNGVDMGKDVWVQASGYLQIESTSPTHGIRVGRNNSLNVDSLQIQSGGELEVGDNSNVSANDGVNLVSIGTSPHNKVVLRRGATIAAGGDISLNASKRAFIGPHTNIQTTGNLNVDAKAPIPGFCIVSHSASIIYGSKSGVCESFLP